jgi:hypothetical protein
MKSPSRVFWVPAIILACAFCASGDTLPADPQAGVHKPSHIGGGGPDASHIGTMTFTFLSPSGSSPLSSPCLIVVAPSDVVVDTPCDFVNSSGLDWTRLTISVSPGEPPVSCSHTLFEFTNCSPIEQGGPTTPSVITFFGGTIDENEAFRIPVNGWQPNTEFVVTASTPEPGTFALLLTSFVPLLLRWKLRLDF